MPITRKRHHILPEQPLCSICNEPVNLRTAKSDENGRAVHEECYIQKITSQQPSSKDKNSKTSLPKAG
jgi:hypothetical protein